MSIEDREDLDGTAMARDDVRHRGIEVSGLAGPHEVFAVSELETGGALEHIDPFAARMDLRLASSPGRKSGLGDDPAQRIVRTCEQPVGGPVDDVAGRLDEDVVVRTPAEQVVDRRTQRVGESSQLVEGDAALTGLEAADRGGPDEAPLGQLVE